MEDLLLKIIDKAVESGATYADLRFEDMKATRIEVRNKEITTFRTNMEYGLGLRVLANGAWGFVSANDPKELLRNVKRGVKVAKASGASRKEKVEIVSQKSLKKDEHWKPKKRHESVAVQDKLGFVMEANKRAKDADSRIAQVSTSYLEGFTKRWFVNSEGSFLKHSKANTGFVVGLVARSKDVTAERSQVMGGLSGLEVVPFDKGLEMVERETKTVLDLLDAPKPPAGNFPAILNFDLGYTFAHECLGHLCEADYVLSGESILEGKLGTVIASEPVTVIDNPTLVDAQGIPAYGSYPFDDEGIKTRPTTLIKTGKLVSFMHNRETAKKFKVDPTGNARVESYKNLPLVRMSNVYFQPGSFTEEELIEDVKDGVYLLDSYGGQTSTSLGTFHVGVQLVYLIKNGEVGSLCRGTAVAGRTLDVLKQVKAVGRDSGYDIGACGKGDPGQTVRCGTTGPPVRLGEITIGG